MTVYKRQLNGIEFKFIVDIDTITGKLVDMANQYEEGLVRYMHDEDDGTLSKEEYASNVNHFSSIVCSWMTPDYMDEAIAYAQKKKNGYLWKNMIYSMVGCDNTRFIQEWHNTWIYERAVIKAIDDTTLELTIRSITDTPG